MTRSLINEPLFTVIIPAKDRAEYLYHTLRTCSHQDYENLEVIVSDDGSTDHTRAVVEAASKADSRIRYVSPGAGVGVGMRENFEFALGQVKPGYVIALGADDGLLPHAMQGMLQVMRSTRQDLLAWPTPIYSYAGARTPTSQLMLYRRDKVKVIDAQRFLANQVDHLNYLGDVESPMFYVKGVVSTELIDRVKSRSQDGRFYCCPTPDGYSGIVLAGEVSSYAFSGKPFSIYGVSPSSQGMSYLAGDEQARKRSEAFFQNVADSPMHASLAAQPYSPLISLMTADYILTAADLPGWPGKVPPIAYRRLLQRALGELAHGLFSENRLARELNILHRIAALHGLGDFFTETLGRTRRHAKKDHFAGNGLSPSQFFLDGDTYGLHNVFDAAYFAYCAHEFLPKVSLSTVGQAVCNSLRYRLQSRRRGEPFPIESIWRTELKGP